MAFLSICRSSGLLPQIIRITSSARWEPGRGSVPADSRDSKGESRTSADGTPGAPSPASQAKNLALRPVRPCCRGPAFAGLFRAGIALLRRCSPCRGSLLGRHGSRELTRSWVKTENGPRLLAFHPGKTEQNARHWSAITASRVARQSLAKYRKPDGIPGPYGAVRPDDPQSQCLPPGRPRSRQVGKAFLDGPLKRLPAQPGSFEASGFREPCRHWRVGHLLPLHTLGSALCLPGDHNFRLHTRPP
jgi:hypothetical protein